MMQQRIHGGPDAQGVPLHDFSTNANACGPCPHALAALQAADATRYPDPAYSALRQSLGAFHGVAPARIVCAASGSEFIFRITGWAAQRGVRTAWLPLHGYGDYAQAAQSWGLVAASQPGEDALAWACDPSSPLGAAQPDLQAWATSPHLAVLDRAYEPLRLEGSLSLDGGQVDRFWQLWTPNKALGLTGVRGAYAIAPTGGCDAAAQLEASSPSWPLGAHAVAMLQAWCEAPVQQWLAGSLETLRAWKLRQQALCERMQWTVLPGHANFLCARADAFLNTDILGRLRARGIKLRDCASFGLPGHVRLSVQAPASQDALYQAWERLT